MAHYRVVYTNGPGPDGEPEWFVLQSSPTRPLRYATKQYAEIAAHAVVYAGARSAAVFKMPEGEFKMEIVAPGVPHTKPGAALLRGLAGDLTAE